MDGLDSVGLWNGASDADAAAALASCLDVPRWIDAVVASRPHRDEDALRHACLVMAEPLTADEVDRALRSHPRIGDVAEGDGTNARHARAEQSGVDTADNEVAQRLRTANQAYEDRFGRVFLIRAAGRDADDVLAAIESRLHNDPSTELGVVERELREIAVVRATGLVPS